MSRFGHSRRSRRLDRLDGVLAVNRPIVRLYGLVVVLFAVLIAFTSRWTVFEASSLRTSELNVRGLLQQERIDRGPILAANGAVLAHSVRGAEGTYSRSYPRGSEFTAPVGYSFVERGQVGLELYRNAALDGEDRQQRAAASSTSCKVASLRATRSSRRCSPPHSRRRSPRSANTKALSWRSTRAPGRSR